MDVNLEYYKIFYYAAKYGSITVAAEKLLVSQPAVSQAIKQLENALELKLFYRTSKGVRMTPEGELLYEYAAKGYEMIKEGERRLSERANLETGEIKIGASDMTLQFYLLPFLEKFHKKYPKIKITVTNAPTPETMQYLETGKIDFGIISLPIEAKHNIEIMPVKEIEDIFVAGNKFKELKRKQLSFQSLEKLPIICLERTTTTRRYIDKLLLKNNVILKPEFELATSDMIVQFALRNLGIGCVMKEFADKYLETGELFELTFFEHIPKRSFAIIKMKGVKLSILAEKLFELFRE